MRPSTLVLTTALTLAMAPAGATAQFGAVEALASRVSDLSFYFGTGGLTGGTGLEAAAFGVRSFGVELLFEAAAIPSAEARARRAAAPTGTRRVLRRMEVRHGDAGTDTIYHYDVEQVAPPGFGPDDILWTLEVGIGYGQTDGFKLDDPGLELNTTVRSLPAITLYLSYEPIGSYVGLRTGFMRTDALQVVDPEGQLFRGGAEAFMMGALAGYAFSLRPAWLFIEGGYTLRDFPSVDWTTAPGPLPPALPRRLDVSGWSVSAGIQFPVR